MKKKGNKKMPSPRHKLIHNPIPTSLFCLKILLFVEKKSSHRIGYMKFIVVLKETDVGTRLMNGFVSG